MNRVLRTHREWLSETKRLVNSPTLRTSAVIAAYKRVASRVERAIAVGINDWHLAQTWHLLSLVQEGAADDQGAATTLERLVDHHQALLTEHRRAFVSGAAAAAVQLSKAGDLTGARRMLRRAGQVGRGLKPQEDLLRQANTIVTADSKKRSTALAHKRVKPSASNRRAHVVARIRRGLRTDR
jgi:hypothetical protein